MISWKLFQIVGIQNIKILNELQFVLDSFVSFFEDEIFYNPEKNGFVW